MLLLFLVAACLLISDDQSSAVRRLAQATPTALQSDPVLRHCNAVALLLSAGMTSENETRSKKTLNQSIEFACREFEACGAALTRDELRRCIAARDDVLPVKILFIVYSYDLFLKVNFHLTLTVARRASVAN